MPKLAGDSGGGGRRSEDLRLVFIRVGAAVTLSLAGLLLSRRRRQPRQLRLPPPPRSSESDAMKGGGGLKDELRILKNEDTKAKIINGNSVHTTTTTTTTTMTAMVPMPPKCRTYADDEGFLLPEFNEIVFKEFGRDIGNITTSPAPTEQDAAMRELENQLKINTVESKLYTLKIESLKSENERLQAQLTESSKVVSELEATRMKCKLLKKKLRQDAEQAKEIITSLQEMVDSLQRKEIPEGKVSAEVEKKLNKIEELENETRELRVVNSRLQQENAHLVRRLELIRLPPVSKPINSMEVKALQEADHLRQENDKLAKEIEKLQADRFADVEELVYLKWINACLRYELRNQEAPSGKSVARGLSKTLSPKSEEKAKQLIMEYANAGGDEKNLEHIEFGSEYSSSRASSGEPDDTSIDMSLMKKHRNPKTKKFFAKLRKLVLGKEKENKNIHALERRVSISSCSFDDYNGGESNDSYSSFMTETGISANPQRDYHSCRWHSLDSQTSGHLSKEVGDERSIHLGVKSASFGEGRVANFGHSSHLDNGQATIPEDAEIHKFAEALKTSRPGSSW
uniref:Protein CHUP1, chloroplastic n=1 Tax=Leersia perrieri TaxID=77586 RepID=A0A0D9WDJ2_9ORYZ